MDIELKIISVGDTTMREISNASAELYDVLERLPGVEQVDVPHQPAPDGAMGVGATAGAFLLKIAPAAFHSVMKALKAALAPHPPAKVLIKTKNGKFSFEFDPKTVSLQELVAAADRLRTASPPA